MKKISNKKKADKALALYPAEFVEMMEDNDIVQQAINGEPINSELYNFLGGDIMMLSYIKRDLKAGQPIEKVAKFYGRSVEEIKKYILKERCDQSKVNIT